MRTGNLLQEPALDASGEAITAYSKYMRSFVMNSINLFLSPKSRVTWFSIDHVSSGHLKFNPHEEDRVIQVSQARGAYFQAHCLAKVNNSLNGDKEFYPEMNFIRLCTRCFVSKLHGRAISVTISCYSYHCCSNVWRAFCELWGPLSNTFHHGNGEMGISLYDLKVIGGLPILGLQYDECIPLNEELCREDLYPLNVELLRIHTQLYIFHKKGQVFCNHWVEHFFRGEAVYGATGNGKNIIAKQVAETRKLPLNISHEG
ncbi:unnamed protein product [Prunus armeniaca]|uniref:Aminotransferase-like plant mobile domain-containing protein n=1 Tax=Prunus armeniaca TaxID=36596 RepID=A0A6J5TXX8_PRUAR|nr:unnamed protein product [Prunus armeniaca]